MNFLKTVAYVTAPAIAFFYTAGYISGQWLHQCNQDLAEFHASFFQSQSYIPFVNPLYVMAMELETLPHKELQAKFQFKSKLSKKTIIASGFAS